MKGAAGGRVWVSVSAALRYKNIAALNQASVSASSGLDELKGALKMQGKDPGDPDNRHTLRFGRNTSISGTLDMGGTDVWGRDTTIPILANTTACHLSLRRHD